MTLLGNLAVERVAEVERVALASWPALEIAPLDGWLLRHAAGITRRANSVWPNDLHGDRPIEEKLLVVEDFYHSRKLPSRFQICPAAVPAELDELLAQRGYRAVARTAVQTTSVANMLRHLEGVKAFKVHVSIQPSEEWWNCYAEADEVPLESVAARKKICANIQAAAAYATVMQGDKTIAVASAVLLGSWVGFFNVATLPGYRRMGAAQALLSELAQWGQRQGATDAYLQVMANNEAALNLYTRLGFVTGYYYHYREEVLTI